MSIVSARREAGLVTSQAAGQRRKADTQPLMSGDAARGAVPGTHQPLEAVMRTGSVRRPAITEITASS